MGQAPAITAVCNREVPQESTGFSPFELLYGRQVREPFDVVRETWEADQKSSEDVISYALRMRERLEEMTEEAQTNLAATQRSQKTWYDRSSRSREFSSGDNVLVLLPSSTHKLHAEWTGPNTVRRKVGAVNYEVYMPDKRMKVRVFHVNMLRGWYHAKGTSCFTNEQDEETSDSDEEIPQLLSVTSKGTWRDVVMGKDLDEQQLQDFSNLLAEFSDVLSDDPGKTHVISHCIDTGTTTPVRQRPYRLRFTKRETVGKELQAMEEMAAITPSSSEWTTPIVFVPKKDGTTRFCVDYRGLNRARRFDAYPMPLVDDIIDKLGKAKYISTLHLTREYWQVPSLGTWIV